MSVLHRIDVPSGARAGQTTVSPQNPQGSTVTSPTLSTAGKIALAYGALGVRTTFQTVTQEIRAGGNEELATDLENLGSGLAFVTGVVATKGLSLIPTAFTEVSSAITRSRANARQNRNIAYERELLGSRVNFNQGRAYE